MNVDRVIFGFCERGYTVRAMAKDVVVKEYNAGNSRADSLCYIDPDSPNALTVNEIQWAAGQTARMTAEEFGVTVPTFDSSLSREIKESLSAFD